MNEEPTLNTPSSVRDSDDGWTALFFAIETGNLDIIRFLLERGAKVNVAPGNYENPTQILKRWYRVHPDTPAAVERVGL